MFESMDIPYCRKVLETLDQAESQPDFNHNQARWFYKWGNQHTCGTSACTAGTACLLSDKVEIRNTDVGYMPFVNGEMNSWSLVAGELMGLDEGQCRRLFYSIHNDQEARDLLRNWISQAEKEQYGV